MVPFGGNVEEVRRGTHSIPQTDHREAIEADRRRRVGDARGGSSVGSVRNAVGDDLCRETAGNLGTVGGVTTDIQSVCRGKGIRGRRMQEGGLVFQRGNIETTSGHIGRSLTGG